ncbi:MAG: M20/M25/M40 family metallo-hydrolase [Ruminococcaceae bacterium]|nr:M20/M25/M40 family metallo-hydrolase [Oscillospiraceae bacterium]
MTLYIVLGLVATLIAFIAVLVVRALNFKPKKGPKLQTNEITFDNDLAIKNLSELIKCKTISYNDKSLEDDAEFNKLTNMLPQLYPNVYSTCEQIDIPDRAILLKWRGKSAEKPTVLMAHYDVVPVNEENWAKPPFDAVIEDGVLWGRGTLDTKITFNSILFATEKLIADGFVPENDIYLAFSGGEEINGLGAVNIVDYFESNGIELGLVVDEGGGVVENVFPGVNVPCGLIGIAEKGLMNVQYKCSSKGGHASAPKPNSPVVRLSKACCKIESKPFKSHFTTPVVKMFDTLGRHSSFVFKIIFSNLWLFKPVLDMICRSGGGELNALVRTTVAFTKMQGSSAYNVIPPKATLVSNMRLNPADTMDSALEYLKKTVNDENVEISIIEGMNPSRISQVDCEAWDKVATAVASTWKGCVVAPYLMMQCSDSRHYGRISDKVYRFSAMDLTAEERATIHGDNEHIRLDAADRTVEFYIRLITQC